VTAPSVRNVQAAVEHIYPLCEEFRKPKTDADVKDPLMKSRRAEMAAKRAAEDAERAERKRRAAAEAAAANVSRTKKR